MTDLEDRLRLMYVRIAETAHTLSSLEVGVVPMPTTASHRREAWGMPTLDANLALIGAGSPVGQS